jgi:hypothetical protein
VPAVSQVQQEAEQADDGEDTHGPGITKADGRSRPVTSAMSSCMYDGGSR